MILRWVARLWLWLTEEHPPKHRPNPYPKGDPPCPSPPLRLVTRDDKNGLTWPDDDD